VGRETTLKHAVLFRKKLTYSKLNVNPNVIMLSIILLFALRITLLSGTEITLVKTFETWNANIIKSTDPAGITYHPQSGHLFISDSEIDEITSIWNCENIFEINLAGNQVFNTFDSYNPGGLPCPPTTNGTNREPTGITFSEFDGYFYVSDDGEHAIMRYDDTFGAPLAILRVTDADFEGITCDPSTGFLYVVSGEGQDEVNVYSSDLVFLYQFSVAAFTTDPEGIAYSSQLKHLFLLSRRNGRKIYEVTLDGNLVASYDISHFLPAPIDPQGLTFAPSSDPNDDPNNLNIYIVDGQIDNSPIPENDRDGLIYEAKIDSTTLKVESNSIPFEFSLSQNYPNPFNPETLIRFQMPEAAYVVMSIYNVHGQEIRGLLDGPFIVGSHSVHWDGKDNHANHVPSGVYFYQLQASKFYQVKKMILLK
jgi:hypothetical protein